MAPVILVLSDYYLPGYQAGGSLRTVVNMVELLGDELDFKLATRDRDCSETEPYPDVVADVWKRLGKAEVIHLSRHGRSPTALVRLIRSIPHDAIYLNSFFQHLNGKVKSIRLKKGPAPVFKFSSSQEQVIGLYTFGWIV